MKAAILGATGYTGMLLGRLLSNHPGIDTILPVSSSRAGKSIADFDNGYVENEKLIHGNYLTISEMAQLNPDVIYAGLPHLASAEICGPFVGKSVVIDLSADFRISDPKLFESAYGAKMPSASVPPVYGLSEFYGSQIKKADLIANPGCYPTATMLPLLPILKTGITTGPVIVNAISGISGAGRKAVDNNLFCERSENTGAYNPGRSHRHWAEMTDQVRQNGGSADIFFTPHLAPLRRGMSVSTTLELTAGNEDKAGEILRSTFNGTPFVRILENRLPQTREVCGSNRCDIAFRLDGSRLFLFSCIDNLVKGASGQAVQNMNLRFGFKETAGLEISGLV